MQSFILREPSQQSLPLILILIITTLLLATGCKDSGSVGGAIGGPGTEVNVDTMQVEQVSTDTVMAFTGALNFISVGRFQDPLFGDLNALGLMKPQLASTSGNGTFTPSTEMTLRLAINKGTVYGDTLSEARFNLVEITELWRERAWRINDEIELAAGDPGSPVSPRVGSFTVTDEDTITVPLSSTFAQKYGDFYSSEDSLRDSLYVQNFFGLAIQPQNESKIITINPDDSRFIITDLDTSEDTTLNDSLAVGLRDAAYALDRTGGQAVSEGKAKIYNTLEKVLTFDFDFSSDNIDAINISKVELIISRDALLLEQTLPPGAVRPDVETLFLHLVEGDELPQSIDPGNPLAQGTYQEEDNAYHFNLTQLINAGVLESADPAYSFYVTLSRNDGVIRSDVVYLDQAPVNKPKVIITSINNE